VYGCTQDSVKQDIRMRRIVMKADGDVWQIRPACVMPYMTCEPKTTEKMLFWEKWTPAWAFAHVFAMDVMTIHRLTTHLGRYHMVGTTVNAPKKIPTDLDADEKHRAISGTLFTCGGQNSLSVFGAFQGAFLKKPINRAIQCKIDTS